ncbi:MAG: MFS transporter [Candidatus Riflebacteria bacterium]|nr:MFS transporter [Candidatus Riflebacteria bacterium]
MFKKSSNALIHKLVFLFFFLIRGSINVFFVTSQTVFFIVSGVSNLPAIYTIMNLVYISLQFFSLKSCGTDSLKYIIRVMLLFMIILILRIFVFTDSGGFIAAGFLLSVMLFDIFFSQYFMHFINDLYPLQEGKKVLPRISGIGSLSFIISGLLLKGFLEIAGIEAIVISTFIIYLFSVAVIILISSLLAGKTRLSDALNQSNSVEMPGASGLRLNGLPFLILITIFINMFGKYSLDFQYSKVITSEFQSSEKLAGFIAVYSAVTDIAILVLQYFLSGKIFHIFGLSRSLEILPFSIFILSLLSFFEPSFYPVLLTQFCFTLLSKSVFQPSVSLITGVFSSAERMKMINLIGITGSAGAILSGLSLIFLKNYLDMRMSMFVITIIFAAMAVAAGKSALAYPQELDRRLLTRSEIDHDAIETLVFCRDDEQKIRLLDKLLNGDYEMKKMAIEKAHFLSVFAATDFLKKVILYEEDQKIAADAAKVLSSVYGEDGTETILKLLSDSEISERSKCSILESLNEKNYRYAEKTIISFLRSNHHRLKSSAAFLIIRFSENTADIKAALSEIFCMLNDIDDPLKRSAAVACLGILQYEVFAGNLCGMMLDSDRKVAENAVHFLCRLNLPQTEIVLREYLKKCPETDIRQHIETEISRLRITSNASSSSVLYSLPEAERNNALIRFSKISNDQVIEDLIRILLLDNSSCRQFLFGFFEKRSDSKLLHIVADSIVQCGKLSCDNLKDKLLSVPCFPDSEMSEMSEHALQAGIKDVFFILYKSIFLLLKQKSDYTADLTEHGNIENLFFRLASASSRGSSPNKISEAITQAVSGDSFASSIAFEFLENHLEREIFDLLSEYLRTKRL